MFVLGCKLLIKNRTMVGQKKHKLTSLKPISWGKGTEQVSEQIDEILYED